MGVICAAWMLPNEVIPVLVERKVTAEFFHVPAHATVYSTLLELWEAGKPLDMIHVAELLMSRDLLLKVGGIPFLTELQSYLPTAANARHHLEILTEKHLLRQMYTVATKIQTACLENQEDASGTLDAAEESVLGVRRNLGSEKITSAKQETTKALEAIYASYENRGRTVGLPTGFHDLDRMTGGLRPAKFYVIAGRPSEGKTAFAMNIAKYVAVEGNYPVGVISAEMSTEELMQGLIATDAKVNLVKVRNGVFPKVDQDAIDRSAQRFHNAPLHFDDTPRPSIQQVRAKARRMKQKYGIQLLVVDYLQLLTCEMERSQKNRVLEVASISGGLKAIGKELHIAILALAQIGRDFEHRGAQARPRLSDLKESGAIEQDADFVGFLVREERYAESDEQRRALEGKATLVVPKQRDGPIGDIPLRFQKEFRLFTGRAYESEEQQPALL